METYLTNNADIWQGFSVWYADGFKYFIGAFFLIFFFGSLFAKAMADSGSANAISYKLLSVFGPQRALLVVILSTAVLTYGGVSVFVVTQHADRATIMTKAAGCCRKSQSK